jgi:hypothetical protein
MFGRWYSGFPGVLFTVLIFFGFTPGCKAQQIPVDNSRERSVLAESFASEKLWSWQKRLKLDDWRISVSVSRASELKPKTLGNIHWDSDKKTAIIRVLDPADYRLPFHEMLDDIEFTVVHELIHLKLSPLLSTVPRSEASRRDEEHTVNGIADALLAR